MKLLIVIICLLSSLNLSCQCSLTEIVENSAKFWLADTVRPTPLKSKIFIFKDSLTDLISHDRIEVVDKGQVYNYVEQNGNVEFYTLELASHGHNSIGVLFQSWNGSLTEEDKLLIIPGFREQIWQPSFVVSCNELTPIYWGEEGYITRKSKKIIHQVLKNGFGAIILDVINNTSAN